MSRENQAMVKLLFSEKNLKSKMDVGFKGNPNIGSVVLNQIVNSDDFDTFANGFLQVIKYLLLALFWRYRSKWISALVENIENWEFFSEFSDNQ